MLDIQRRPLTPGERLALEGRLAAIDQRGRRTLWFMPVAMGGTIAALAALTLVVDAERVTGALAWIFALAVLVCAAGAFAQAWWEWKRLRRPLALAISRGEACEYLVTPTRAVRIPAWEDFGEGYAFEVAGPRVLIYFGQDLARPKGFPSERFSLVQIRDADDTFVDEFIVPSGKRLEVEKILPSDFMKTRSLPDRIEVHPGSIDALETMIKRRH